MPSIASGNGSHLGGVQVEGLGYRYAGRHDEWALRDLTLAAQPGEVLAVVGPSGSGKSTLLRLLCGLAAPSAGRVLIAGADQAGVPPQSRPVAMVFQGFALFPHLTARANIEFGPRVRREPKRRTEQRVADAAEGLGLTRLLERYPGQLSGGERQRVALARALVREPALFCLDEPLSSLDPVLRTDARRMLAELLRADGRCAVYVTHDQAEAMTVGDRVAVLRAGELEQVGTPRQVYDAPGSAFVASFLGTPPMALLPVGLPGVVAAGPVDSDARLGVRAEDVMLQPGTDAVVTAVEDLGHETHVVLDLDGHPLLARAAHPGRVPGLGERVSVHVDPERVRVFAADGRAR